MPNGGVKSSRSSPYWRNASPPPRRNLSSEQSSNRVGQQLLRTLAQSLPSGQEAVRSRSSCPTTPRRRRQASVCRSMGSPDCVPLVSHSKLKTPVRLKAGMPVNQCWA
ncbi:GD12697 [Drosophila simulans]|uniref:GD12697 n=1 Tax=Drosophila simulans TaxID=7240 RepID=B4QRR6_DROSI|nr:GD12697 [Drosophila simulans]